jgi:hypothetical protein
VKSCNFILIESSVAKEVYKKYRNNTRKNSNKQFCQGEEEMMMIAKWFYEAALLFVVFTISLCGMQPTEKPSLRDLRPTKTQPLSRAGDWVDRTNDWCCESCKIPRCFCGLLASVGIGTMTEMAYTLWRCGHLERVQSRDCMDETFSLKPTVACLALCTLGLGSVWWIVVGSRAERDGSITSHEKKE